MNGATLDRHYGGHIPVSSSGLSKAPSPLSPQRHVPGSHVLPFLQDSDKLSEPVALHLGGLPKGLELCHLCLPAFLFRGVGEPGDQGGGQRSFEGLPDGTNLPLGWQEGLAENSGVGRTGREKGANPYHLGPPPWPLRLAWLNLSNPHLSVSQV